MHIFSTYFKGQSSLTSLYTKKCCTYFPFVCCLFPSSLFHTISPSFIFFILIYCFIFFFFEKIGVLSFFYVHGFVFKLNFTEFIATACDPRAKFSEVETAAYDDDAVVSIHSRGFSAYTLFQYILKKFDFTSVT